MIIYNVTISVEKEIVVKWLEWMRTEHIPEVMDCGFFIKAQLNRIISKSDNEYTYAVAYTCVTMKDLHNYQIKFAPSLQYKHSQKFGKKAIAFRTLLEVVEEF